jgi:predicted GNAT family acetyltransferase
MAKTGPLGKAESFYVEEKYKSGNSIEQIAQDLDRAVGAIEKYIKKCKIEAPKTIVDQQFVRQGGATIMTENASTMIDQKKIIPNRKNPSCVTKIR